MQLQVTPISFTSSYKPNKAKKFVTSLYNAQQKPQRANLGAAKLPFLTRVKKFL